MVMFMKGRSDNECRGPVHRVRRGRIVPVIVSVYSTTVRVPVAVAMAEVFLLTFLVVSVCGRMCVPVRM
jgi:hypothetical protein